MFLNSQDKTEAELKNIIKDIGIVNLGAIEEYERVSTRYNFLMKQKEDLNKAEDTLLEIINDMDNIIHVNHIINALHVMLGARPVSFK